MSDLISRSEYKSKLVKALDVLNKEYREALLNEDNDLILAIQNQQSAYMIALRLLDNEPTAYDVDKVVYEFESFAKLAEDRWTNGTSEHAYQEHKCWVKAIEIVKQEAEQYQSSEIGFISKTEVLTLIEEIKCNDDIPKNYGTLLDIMRMIRNMPTVDNTDNGWIPCSERLPEESGTYIVNAIENSIIHVTFAKWMPRMKKWNLTGCRSYWKVNAWQPLPEPFKERD